MKKANDDDDKHDTHTPHTQQGRIDKNNTHICFNNLVIFNNLNKYC